MVPVSSGVSMGGRSGLCGSGSAPHLAHGVVVEKVAVGGSRRLDETQQRICVIKQPLLGRRALDDSLVWGGGVITWLSEPMHAH